MSNKKVVKRIYNVVITVILLVFIGLICSRFIHPGDVEYTDDAQVWRHITPINARVGGFIKEVRFEDYQRVHKGDTLVIIEDAEFRLALAQAEAGLRGSRSGSGAVSAGMTTTHSNVRAASAGIEESRVQMENARKDFQRFEQLLAKDAVTRQQYDNAKAQYEAAKARYEAAQSRQQATSQVLGEQRQRLGQSTAGESVAQAQVNLARLNLSYTVIVATCDGVMSRKDINEGQLVQPGQQLARIVDDNQVWVVANYRETQMKHVKVGSKVTFTADAVPGITYQGEVESIAAGTGSAFSPIPVDNATGNFVKVEQRVPVRIKITSENKPEDVAKLLAGLNVQTEVKF
ncbi:MAG: HlyD family secretion protein [Muribaculaceae bacterium]|nr:HlyD family secretion protein [Muribaculaceae bacterium]